MTPQELLGILHVAERLKCSTRHCDTSSGRRESVAEHSWRLALMAMLVGDAFPQADTDRVIRMALIHDLGEAFTGDIPAFEKSEGDEEREEKLFADWVESFPEPQRGEWQELLSEFSAQSSLEARICKALDKLEAVIQHDEADISTWLPLEYDLQFSYGREQVAFLPYLRELRAAVDEQTREKIAREGDPKRGKRASGRNGRSSTEGTARGQRPDGEEKGEQMKYLVIDVGGTFVKYALMDEDCHVLSRGKEPTIREPLEGFLGQLQGLWERHGEGAAGLALSLPGILDQKRGFMHTGGAMTCIHDLPIVQVLHERGIEVPISIGNDAKCAAVAEYWRGSLAGCRDAVALILGTGIGGAILHDGEVLQGADCVAGELSFLLENHDPAPEKPWLNLVSIRGGIGGLLGAASEELGIPVEELDGVKVFDAVNAGDERALRALHRHCAHLAALISDLRFVVNPERIAVGGGISVQPMLLQVLREEVARIDEQIYAPIFGKGTIPTPEIVPCTFFNDANLIGALYLLLHSQADYAALGEELEALLAGEQTQLAMLSNTAALLYERVPDLNWAGFYLLNEAGTVLNLGPFQGKSACVRIPRGRGVCGTAVLRDEPLLVADVHDFAGHIACDSASAAELVVPVHRDGKLLGVLDLDSPLVGRFTQTDLAGIGACVELLERALQGGC